MLGLPLFALAYYAYDQQSKPSDCEASTADRIRGNYENKVRFFSPPEKIFETFSTQKDENN